MAWGGGEGGGNGSSLIFFFLGKNPHVFISSESVIDGARELFHFGHKACVWDPGHFWSGVIIQQFQLESAHLPGIVQGSGALCHGPEQVSAQQGHGSLRGTCSKNFFSHPSAGRGPCQAGKSPGGLGGVFNVNSL